MTKDTKDQIKNLGEELTKLLIGLNDEEKSIALAMLQGMIVGKQIAENQKTA